MLLKFHDLFPQFSLFLLINFIFLPLDQILLFNEQFVFG